MFQELDDTKDEHLDGLLKTVINLEQSTGKRCEADIITWRGMMTKVNSSAQLREFWLIFCKIMTTPYDNTARYATSPPVWRCTLTSHSFEMNATKFQVREPSGVYACSSDLTDWLCS